MLLVMKFGGSSLTSAQKLSRAAELIKEQRQAGDDVVVVVSAQGDTTDELLEKAGEICRVPNARELDVLLSCGEQMSMALMAIALESIGCKAVSLCGWQAGILTENRHGAAKILGIDACRVKRELAAGKVVIVAGFQGKDEADDITTIGRGGSDTTAVALAAALQADYCRIYTDVCGVYSADPRVVEGAKLHRDISYDEMLEMAALGAQVLHSRAVELAREKNVRLEVRSSFLPENAGTVVGMEKGSCLIRGVTCDGEIAVITVRGLAAGTSAAELFELLAEEHVSVDTVIRSKGEREDAVSFSLKMSDADRTEALLNRHLKTLGCRMAVSESEMAKVSIVGAGLADGSAAAAKMLRALQKAGIVPRMITTGEIRISVILPQKEAQEAVRALHGAFFGT